jgi:2-polyprenyl-6-hydroxyphenyl methylase/3-demethylubiquinone-9 3-methyltransferase
MIQDPSLVLSLVGAQSQAPGLTPWGEGALFGETVVLIIGALFQRATELQTRLTSALDQFLPSRYRVYGRRYYRETLVPRYLVYGQTVYDVGGGANPFLALETKARLGARVVGIDISASELERAPEGSYDETRCADIAEFRGAGDADIIICQSVLEHVRDVRAAFHSLASILRPGGRALLFVPNRNAPFARLNRLLPERVKRGVLFSLYPQKRPTSGFPAYYDRCTPRDFRGLAEECGLAVEAEEHFYICSYFFGILPAYVLWRIWILAGKRLFGAQASSTFCMVLSKPAR